MTIVTYGTLRVKLNEHWYSDTASKAYSVQCDESDNRITINEDIVHNQSLKTADITKKKQNRDDNEQLHTELIESTNVDMINTENDEDTELAEEQIAINH